MWLWRNRGMKVCVSWFDPARKRLWIRSYPEQFTLEGDQKSENRQLEVDALLDVVVEDKAMLLHLEFQTYNDSDMPERLLRYNVLARSEYKLPVLSCVIHLLRDGVIWSSPLHWAIPTGQEILQFAYVCIEIGESAPRKRS